MPAEAHQAAAVAVIIYCMVQRSKSTAFCIYPFQCDDSSACVDSAGERKNALVTGHDKNRRVWPSSVDFNSDGCWLVVRVRGAFAGLMSMWAMLAQRSLSAASLDVPILCTSTLSPQMPVLWADEHHHLNLRKTVPARRSSLTLYMNNL